MDNAVQLMQQKLVGAEKDTRELAKMLIDLGIQPTDTPDKHWSGGSDTMAMVDSIFSDELNQSDSSTKLKEKHVKFDPCLSTETKQKIGSFQSILKRPIKPLQVKFDGSDINSFPSGDHYATLVNRLCKTESVIQSLKLSLCSMQTSYEASDREKSIVIDKLKEEIRDQENKVKKQETEIHEAQRRKCDAEQRWKEAEKEVKDLHDRIEELTKKSRGATKEEDTIRDKYSKKIEEAKMEIAREKEIREVIENSHLSLLSRVQDMEEALAHERSQVAQLVAANKQLKESNTNYQKQTNAWNEKAATMESTLVSLKSELDAKEEAIRRLVEEEQNNNRSNSNLALQQAALHKELKQCNVLLDAQKAAVSQLEQENQKLLAALEKEKRNCEELEDCKKKIEDGESEKRLNEEAKLREAEKKWKSEMRMAVNKEKRRADDAEARITLMEECIKKQEMCLKDKEEEFEEKEKEADQRLFEERKKTNLMSKERDRAVKAKENLMKSLNKAASDVSREKEYLQQELEELKLEQSVIIKEKMHLEDENASLMNRIAAIEHQETAYKRAQDLAVDANRAKTQLAYENGKLQTRVEQLEDELRAVASVQSQVVQLRTTNRALEQKYSQISSELASTRVDSSRSASHIKQLENGMVRKESDFNLALAARDEALREKEAALAQVDAVKEHERNKLAQMTRELNSCRSDNERLSSAVADFTDRFAYVQQNIDNGQLQLGRKDAQLAALLDERTKYQSELSALQTQVSKLEGQIYERDTDEQARIAPALEALERARLENVRLADSLDDALSTNVQLKQDLDKHKTDLEIQRERSDMLARQQEAQEAEANMTARNQSDRLRQMKEQFARERATLKKQMQGQLTESKKCSEATQSRNTQLSRGNSELRAKVANQELTINKLKEKVKQQKVALGRHQAERKANVMTENKIKEIDSELEVLEKSKTGNMKKNKEQAAVIAKFNAEVTSLKDDITALSYAQKTAREVTLQLEGELNQDRAEKGILVNKIKSLDGALKQAIREKQNAEEKLKKVQIESIHVQQNLQEAQSWFKDKFDVLQHELSVHQQERNSVM